MIGIYTEQNHRDWDVHIPELTFALNTSIHSSIGVSPAFLNMGRSPAPPSKVVGPPADPGIDPPETPETPETLGPWKTRLDRMTHLYDLARKFMGESFARQAAYHDRGRSDKSFSLGDLVLRKNRVLSQAAVHFTAKLAPKFDGPYVIVNKISPTLYDLEGPNNNRMNKIHIDDLRPFNPRNPPDADDAERREEDPPPLGERTRAL